MSVRIANGAGFWGDYPDATARLLETREFDYLGFLAGRFCQSTRLLLSHCYVG